MRHHWSTLFAWNYYDEGHEAILCTLLRFDSHSSCLVSHEFLRFQRFFPRYPSAISLLRDRNTLVILSNKPSVYKLRPLFRITTNDRVIIHAFSFPLPRETVPTTVSLRNFRFQAGERARSSLKLGRSFFPRHNWHSSTGILSTTRSP